VACDTTTSRTIAFSAFHGSNPIICHTAILEDQEFKYKVNISPWKFSETLNKAKDTSI